MRDKIIKFVNQIYNNLCLLLQKFNRFWLISAMAVIIGDIFIADLLLSFVEFSEVFHENVWYFLNFFWIIICKLSDLFLFLSLVRFDQEVFFFDQELVISFGYLRIHLGLFNSQVVNLGQSLVLAPHLHEVHDAHQAESLGTGIIHHDGETNDKEYKLAK